MFSAQVMIVASHSADYILFRSSVTLVMGGSGVRGGKEMARGMSRLFLRAKGRRGCE